MKKTVAFLMAGVLALATVGCKKDDPSVSDDAYYNALACSMLTAVSQTYNQNLAGRPSTGSVDITVDSPYGGTVHITGSLSTDNDITTADLDYDMQQMRWLWSSDNNSLSSDITMTGVMHEVGTFNGNNNYSNTAYTSTSLAVTGTVKTTSAERTVNEKGKVAITTDYTDYDGEVFGYVVKN